MPNTREKLTHLLASKPELLKNLNTSILSLWRLVDHLIANGVTVQECGRWIPHNKGQNTWVECSVCNTVGSPVWKCCPVCETKMPKPPKLGNKPYHQLDECSPQTEEGE